VQPARHARFWGRTGSGRELLRWFGPAAKGMDELFSPQRDRETESKSKQVSTLTPPTA
jgi:hypothetical protein